MSNAHSYRKALEVCREMIRGRGLEHAVVDMDSMDGLGTYIDRVLAQSAGPAHSGWISVKDRLPEARYGVGVGHPAIISDNVLVCVEGDVSVANYDQEENIWTSQEGGVWAGLEPTHWMPLPASPSVATAVIEGDKK